MLAPFIAALLIFSRLLLLAFTIDHVICKLLQALPIVFVQLCKGADQARTKAVRIVF